MATQGRKAYPRNRDLAADIDRYFAFASSRQRAKNNDPEDASIPTLTGLASFLGVDRRTLYRWSNGDDQERAELVSMARAWIEAELEQMLFSRRTFRAAKFSLMFNFGWGFGR